MTFFSSVLNAVTNRLPKAALTGCLFHLAKNNYRKLCELGHKVWYENDEDFNIRMKCFTALAFLPPNEVLDAFLSLTSHENFPIEFITYFELNYIGVEGGPRGKR